LRGPGVKKLRRVTVSCPKTGARGERSERLVGRGGRVPANPGDQA
jgi:hypothetical protein